MHKSYEGAPADGSAWTDSDCNERVMRGGAWNWEPSTVRSASRAGESIVYRSFDLGFRVARTLDTR